MENNRTSGSRYEAYAAAYLEKRGYRVIEKNFRCHIGEIDLIAVHRNALVFIEVKYRKTAAKGSPVEAVTKKKQRTIYKVAQYYMMTHSVSPDTVCRFDVVAILGETIEVIPNAFGGIS